MQQACLGWFKKSLDMLVTFAFVEEREQEDNEKQDQNFNY
jgi:hypothetical protein